VHLAAWPAFDPSLIDPVLSAQMAQVRRLVELGRSARSGASVRMRQPLRRALIGAPGFAELPAALRAEIAAELNVESLSVLGDSELVSYAVKPSFRSLGRRFGSRTPDVAAAILAAPGESIATAVLSGGTVPLRVGSESVLLGADDVIVTQTPLAGWAVATDAGETVAIDIAISPELRREGIAREVIRLIQDARKNDGLEVSDRISLRWVSGDPEVSSALAEHAGMIAREVLAMDFGPGTDDQAAPGSQAAGGPAAEHEDEDLGLAFWLRRV
jgi:isoleucyl-tRNA synthetase